MIRPIAIILCVGSLSVGCATAHISGPAVRVPPDMGQARTVVLEPFFEAAEWETNTRTEYAQVYGGSGMGVGFGSGLSPGGSTVAITTKVTEKPLFARVQVLAQEHRALLAAVARLRPAWRVTSTSGAPVLTGPVSIVRTIVQGNELVESNRTLKNLAFGFGLIIWPLQLFNINPVAETQRIYGALERYDTDQPTLASRLVKYPTQPDFAFNASGLKPLGHSFGLDVPYEEGLLADETPRERVLVDGFADRLAAAVVAIIEEAPPPMSFWDSIKPSKRPPAAVKVDVSADQTGLTLGWDDGVISHVTGQTLRQMCPCAECVEEFSGRRVLDVEKIPPSMKMLEVAPVGNYALTFTFGDLHRTGIFNWSTLRELSKPA